jgi:hypothetical protein
MPSLACFRARPVASQRPTMKYASAFGFAFIALYLLTVVRRFEPDRRVAWILCALVYVTAGLAIASQLE